MFNVAFLGAVLCACATLADNDMNLTVVDSMLDDNQVNNVENVLEMDAGDKAGNHIQQFDYDSDMWLALSALNLTEKNLIDFNAIDGKEEEAIQNIRTTVLFFTRYCGPGSRLWNKIFKSDERTYMDVDYCCKMHDECPNYVEKFDDYIRYPGLEFRPQFFSRFDQIIPLVWMIFFATITVIVSFRIQLDCNASAMWTSIVVWIK